MPAAAAVVTLSMILLCVVSCGPKAPDYQSILSKSSTTTTTTTTTSKPVPLSQYLESIGVTGQQAAPGSLPDLTVSIPTPPGWSRTTVDSGTVGRALNSAFTRVRREVTPIFGRERREKDTISRRQIVVLLLFLAFAVAFAIPAMRDSNLGRTLRGEYELVAQGLAKASFRCPPLHPPGKPEDD